MARLPNNQILEYLRGQIQAGRYDHMPFLPSERNLAAELGVGRGVVRHALQRLGREGVLNLVPNRGACLAAPVTDAPRLRRFIVCGGTPMVPYEMLALLSGLCMNAAAIYAEVVVSLLPDCDTLDLDRIYYRYQQKEIDGVVFLELFRPDILTRMREFGIPYVIANQEQSLEGKHCRVDYRAVGRQAGVYLAAAGHRRIGAVTGELTTLMFREMLAGFRGALAEEELELKPEFLHAIPPSFNASDYRNLVAFLARPARPTALFVMRDKRAEMVYRACAELGLRIPEDISIVGYDNVSWPGGALAGLTTIAQPIAEIAAATVAMLQRWCCDGVPPENQIFPGRLIERDSVGVLKR